MPDLYDTKRNVLMDAKGFSWDSQYCPKRFHKDIRYREVDHRSDSVHTDHTKKESKIDDTMSIAVATGIWELGVTGSGTG